MTNPELCTQAPDGALADSPASGSSLLKQRLKKHFGTCTKAAAVVAGLAAAGDSSAAIVHWSAANLVIPATFYGMYINVETQATSTSGSVTGWDINPYGTSVLNWYTPATPNGMMRYPASANLWAGNLAFGTAVGPAGVFSAGVSGAVTFGAGAGQWTLNGTNYFGFKFTGGDTQIHYGWGKMTVGATATTRTIVEIAYESTPNTAINVGTTSSGCTPPGGGTLAVNGTGCGGTYDIQVSISGVGSSIPASVDILIDGGLVQAGATTAGSPYTFAGYLAGPTVHTVSLVPSDPLCTTALASVSYNPLCNDNVCSATTIVVGTNGTYSNVGATLEVGEQTPPNAGCATQTSWCSPASNTVWFKFVAPSQKISLNFGATQNWDSEIALWSAAACGDLLTGAGTLLAANDDITNTSPFHAAISPICVTPGVTYYVQVDGYGTTTNGAFELVLVDEAPVCDDFDLCTTDSYDCVNNVCVNTPVNCDDNDACTTDGCDPASGCTHTPVNIDDGDPCTTDGCDPVTGVYHTPPVICNDNDACTTDSYDCGLGLCVYTPVNTDDSDACTTDSCDPVTGVSHTPVSTDDSNACTTDGCDPVSGVFHNAVPTDDGNACTTDGCDPVSGVFHNAVNTDDGTVCTTDGCDPVTGVFHNAVSTDDSNACTTDGCDPVTGVFHNAVNTDDSNACTTDGCDPVTGVYHNAVSTDDSNVCTTDGCDPVTGIYHNNVADGTSCGVGTECIGGVCTPIGCPNNNVSLELQTDGNGAQTNWDIVLINTNTVQCSGGISPTYPNNTLITSYCCLPDGCYELRVKDTFGDGMTTGGYRLKDQFGNRIIDNWGDGVFTSNSQIALNTGFCLDLGTDRLTPATCDQETLSTSSVLQANENLAVTGQYGVTNSTSGYQFLFFNPDGGYVRYVFQNMTTGAGTGAQKSRSIQISSLITSPVPSLQLLNVRVRSRVAGVYAPFGPACRMKINPAGSCPTTQLDNIPANIGYTYSCGVTGRVVGATGLTGKIYALSVGGATNYRFRLVSGAYTRTISVTTSYLTLGPWGTQPLLCGTHTYNVDVAISKNNGASYCPYGAVCTVGITNNGGTIPCTTPFSGGSTHSMDVTEGTGVLSMWPNPNRGDQLYLQMTGIDAKVTEVSVDVHDLFGKRVMGQIVTTGGGDLNHVLELGNEMASGLYTVTVMAGDQIQTQRLVIE